MLFKILNWKLKTLLFFLAFFVINLEFSSLTTIKSNVVGLPINAKSYITLDE